ncbi:hypothetical protein, partial [Elizabethkingia anophelis]
MKKEISYRNELAQFVNAIEYFPNSLEVAPFEYDTGKLIKILQKKEVFEICKINDYQFDEVNNIDLKLGKIVADLIKQINPKQSFEEYLEIERKIENCFSGNLYLYAKQGALSVKSLYYYKIKDFSKAITFTLECIVLNDYLVQQGIYTLNLRCFEQNKNISRIYFRNGEVQLGYELISNLITYLFNGKSNNLFGNIFNEKQYWDKVPIIRETYAYELFTMIAEDIIRFNIQKNDIFLPDEWYIDLDFEVNTPDRQIVYNWIYINKQLRSSNYKEYFDSMIYYFQQAHSQFYDILKIFLIIDFHKFINRNKIPNKIVIENKIVDFIENKLNSYLPLR